MTTKTTYRWRRVRPGLYHLHVAGTGRADAFVGLIERGGETGTWYASAVDKPLAHRRRTLREAQDVLIKRVQGRWPE